MGLKLKNCLFYEVKSIKTLESAPLRLAVDLLPLLHKYFYVDLSSNNSRTAHIVGCLSFIKKLAKLRITPVFCVDIKSTELKAQQVLKRSLTKERVLSMLSIKLSCEGLSEEQKTDYLKLKAGPTTQDKLLLVKILLLMGFEVYASKNIEAQKLCAYLRQYNLVDQIYTPDSDVVLYGQSAISDFNFDRYQYTFLNFEKTLEKNNMNLTELVYAAIASGTDFSKGLPKIGPVRAKKLVKENFFQLELDMLKKIDNFEQIKNYFLKEDPVLRGYIESYRAPIEKNLEELKLILRHLDFSEKTIENLID